MIIRCTDIATQKNFNVDDFLAFCEQSSNAWWSCEIAAFATDSDCATALEKEYQTYL